IALLRENGLLPEGVTAAGLITPLDAVLQAIQAFLSGLSSLSLVGGADAAEAVKAPLPIPPIPPEASKEVISQWQAIAASLDKRPGMTYPVKFALMMIDAQEGGMKAVVDDKGVTLSIMGIMKNTPGRMGYDDYLKGVDLPSRRSLVGYTLDHINDFEEKAYFPEAFQKLAIKGVKGALPSNGYEVVKSLITDPVMLANVMDPVFNHSPGAGGGLLRGTVQEVDGDPKPDYTSGYVDRDTIARIAEIGKDPEKRWEFLNTLHERRVQYATQYANPKDLGGLKKRYQFFRDLR
ncbi:MAG: hypothetical protein HQL51_16895, partial [Magnetococcales bacterium]|nr:hypothetical protein [Magnetococcales bacterium]